MWRFNYFLKKPLAFKNIVYQNLYHFTFPFSSFAKQHLSSNMAFDENFIEENSGVSGKSILNLINIKLRYLEHKFDENRTFQTLTYIFYGGPDIKAEYLNPLLEYIFKNWDQINKLVSIIHLMRKYANNEIDFTQEQLKLIADKFAELSQTQPISHFNTHIYLKFFCTNQQFFPQFTVFLSHIYKDIELLPFLSKYELVFHLSFFDEPLCTKICDHLVNEFLPIQYCTTIYELLSLMIFFYNKHDRIDSKYRQKVIDKIFFIQNKFQKIDPADTIFSFKVTHLLFGTSNAISQKNSDLELIKEDFKNHLLRNKSKNENFQAKDHGLIGMIKILSPEIYSEFEKSLQKSGYFKTNKQIEGY